MKNTKSGLNDSFSLIKKKTLNLLHLLLEVLEIICFIFQSLNP